jgi:hypothetical protein
MQGINIMQHSALQNHSVGTFIMNYTKFYSHKLRYSMTNVIITQHPTLVNAIHLQNDPI